MFKLFKSSAFWVLVLAVLLVGYVGWDRGLFGERAVVEVGDTAGGDIVNIFRDDSLQVSSTTSSTSIVSLSVSSSTSSLAATEVSAGSNLSISNGSTTQTQAVGTQSKFRQTSESLNMVSEVEDLVDAEAAEVEDVGVEFSGFDGQSGLIESFQNNGLSLGEYELLLRQSVDILDVERFQYRGADSIRFRVPGQSDYRAAVVSPQRIEIWAVR